MGGSQVSEWPMPRHRRSSPVHAAARSSDPCTRLDFSCEIVETADQPPAHNADLYTQRSVPAEEQSAREIELRGATPFLDEAQVDAGADFEEDILAFLERAHELVVLLTPRALDRPYVWAEIGAAWGRRIPIVALLLGITANELQARTGIPVLLKNRDLLQLNEVEIYLKQLEARVRQGEV